LIDNFAKHNRFDAKELALVKKKYDFVKEHAHFVTGVTRASVEPFGGEVLENRLLRDSLGELSGSPKFDVGYLGFITDKFDIEFVRKLASSGVSILVCGHAYDAKVISTLQAISGVTYGGPFSAQQVPSLISQFRVGIVPYISTKRHDESPIKFFQYVAYGRPVLTSDRFSAIEDNFSGDVAYYNECDISDILSFVHHARDHFERVSSRIRAKAIAMPELFWDQCVPSLLQRVKAAANSRAEPQS
jgi:hypothetical protein